jgi:hypothetical protein
MALKRKITKAEFDALNATLQAEYKVGANGEYVLDADDANDLISARDKEKRRADENAAEVARLKAAQEDEATRRARESGDFKQVEESYKKKLADKDKDHTAELGKLKGYLENILVDGKAQTIAAELAGDGAAVLVPHIRMRLKAEYTDDGPLTRVLGTDGKLTANSVEDLKNEIKKDPAFSKVIIQTRGTGARGAGNGGNGSAFSSTKPLKDMNDAERTAFHKADPSAFAEAVEAEKLRVRGI